MAKKKRSTQNKGKSYFIPRPKVLEPLTKMVFLKESDPEATLVREQVYSAYDKGHWPATPAWAVDLDLSLMKQIDNKPALRMRGQYWRLVKISEQDNNKGVVLVVETKPVVKVDANG